MKGLSIAALGLATLLIALLGGNHSALAGQSVGVDRPLPSEAPFLEAIRQNLARQYDDAFLLDGYTYHLKHTREELTEDGKLKARQVQEYDVVHKNGKQLRKLVSKNGKPLDAEEAAKSKYEPGGSSPRNPQQALREAKAVVDDIFHVMNFKVLRREFVRDRAAIVIEFSPRDNAKPKTRDGKRIVTLVRGLAWVDEVDHVLARVDLRLIKDYKQSGFLPVGIEKGGEVTREWFKFRDEVWLPVNERRQFNLGPLSKRIPVLQTSEFSEYKRFSSEATFKIVD